MTNATLLLAVWGERDNRYGTRRLPLTEQEIEAVRAWRLLEVSNLPADDREVARNIWAQWVPPTIATRRR